MTFVHHLICLWITFPGFGNKQIVVAADGSGDFKSVQQAIESIPVKSNSKHTIIIKPGVYHEQIFIEKDNLHLKGEVKPVKGIWWSNQKEPPNNQVVISYSISREIYRCTQQDNDWGASVINIKARGIRLENLNVVNEYGYKSKGNEYIYCKNALREIRPDGHQFALRCMPGTQRFEAVHCNFHSRGGDTVSPWDVDNGTFYFQNCTMEGGVDMYCPRGWAYAEGCHFLCHNKSAAIWHDGTEYESSKSVIKDGIFEGVDGFKLGRYHRPAQMYLINCIFGDNMANADIYPTTSVPDEKWGRRIYYYNCIKKGTSFDWYKNNIDSKIASKINRSWTLSDRWNTTVASKSNHLIALPVSEPVDLQAENMVLIQFSNGGWPKTLDGKTQPVPYDSLWSSDFINATQSGINPKDATIDNNATTKEIRYLANAFVETGNSKYKTAAEKGIRYLLEMQYDNGGFPQYWPDTSGYYKHITYNDNATVLVLTLLKNIVDNKKPFEWITDSLHVLCKNALLKGIDIIIKSQIEYKGVKTIWCAQHDHQTLLPVKARTYEHPSFTVSESVGIVKFLMSIENPAPEIQQSVRQAILFFDKLKIKDEGLLSQFKLGENEQNSQMWGRFHHLETLKPIFSGRDGIIKYNLNEIEIERIRGYKWYGNWPLSILSTYQEWEKKYGVRDLTGLTFERDTGYTINNAILAVSKSNPEARFVAIKPPKNVSLQKDVIYKPEKNLRVDIYSPVSGKPKAAIIMLHGGGWRTGSKEMHQSLAYDLSSQGYTVYAPEYTLSTHGLYPNAVNDVMFLLSWVNEAGKTKNVYSPVILAGFSAGAQLAGLVAQYPKVEPFYQNVNRSKLPEIKALINIDGIMAFIHNESGEGEDWSKKSAATLWFGYNKFSNPDMWNEASALVHAGKNSPPTLFINSGVERMHAGRDDYLSVLKKENIRFKVITYPEAPHSFIFFDPWYAQYKNEIIQFIKEIK
jgi:PelA/Pel-15E family pectate lyase